MGDAIMLGAIKYNLTNLTNFSGRDARQTFWFYVLFLLIVQYAIGMLIALPMMGSAMSGAFQGVQQGLSDEQMQHQMMAAMAGSMRTSMYASVAISMVSSLLMLAAFVRRLHDSNGPGWIAGVAFALVLASQLYNLSRIGEIIEAMATMDPSNPTATMNMQGMLGVSALAWIGYLVVIVFGAWPSTPGPNRYDEASTQF